MLQIVRDGIDVALPHRSLGPDCVDETPGLALTNQQGRYDFEALVRCVRTLRTRKDGTQSAEAFIVAELDTPASAVLHVSSVLHCGLESCNGPWPGHPFFETLLFKVRR